MDRLPSLDNERTLVGTETSDDAGVFLLDESTALVQTVDVFPPVVGDLRIYGRIVAANSLSDCYAMGAKPVTVMNIVIFPSGKLDISIMAEILIGALENIRISGAALMGGHTSRENEINYGLSVTGIVHPDKIIRNSTAKPGDVVFLTKPIGTGIITTGIRGNLVPPELEAKVSESMATLNKEAAEAMIEVGVSACTDITGFGLMGHAFEMARSSGVTFEVEASKVPLFEEVYEYLEKGMLPGGSVKNIKYLMPHSIIEDGVSEATRDVLFDCQTSGGLFISVPEEKADKLEAALSFRGVSGVMIGRMLKPGKKALSIRK